jgi:hypothetical protein
MSIARRPEKPRKTQEGHLEQENPQKPPNGTKSGKVKQSGKEELRKALTKAKAQNRRSP